MSATIIDGKQIAQSIYNNIAEGTNATLAILSFGEDPAGEVYIRNKMRACKLCGFGCIAVNLPNDEEHCQQAETLVASWASDPNIHGIIIQEPCQFSKRLLNLIPPEKDVDGFRKDTLFTPCTARAVMRLLYRTPGRLPLVGANAVVVGRSDIVGKPVAKLLLRHDCTVTVCHSRTTDLASYTKMADILIVAAGVPGLIKMDMVKPGATVIDVGINRVDGQLVGDVEFEGVKEVAGAITPVPGGVGPMTVACLMDNLADAYNIQAKESHVV